MIRIKPSPTADTRSCDYKNVSKQQLYESSSRHVHDVEDAMDFFIFKIRQAVIQHDHDKFTDLDGFHADFLTGFEQTGWWVRHRKLNRHHLMMDDGFPEDVNLIDVLDFIADCIMAGMARTGTVYPLEIPGSLLQRAFDNTVSMLKGQVVVEHPEPVEEKHIDPTVCPECGGPTTHDRELPPNPYVCDVCDPRPDQTEDKNE